MKKTPWHLQNLAVRQDSPDLTQEPTALLPALTLPTHQQTILSLPSPATPPPAGDAPTGQYLDEEPASQKPEEEEIAVKTPVSPRRKLLRGAALTLCLLLLLSLYLVLHSSTPASSAPTITPQGGNNTSSFQSGDSPATSGTTIASGMIQVYILGAIKQPGVYTLPADARVYQLVQAAGGPLPDADLVTLNLAAKLTDGQEIYVLAIGERPPSNLNTTSSSGNPTAPSGQAVNINTATATEMEQVLHVSAATAQKIINYRIQHGPYTAVNQLLQVVSQAIYSRIQNMVTV